MIFNITKGIACSRLFNLLGRTLLFHITILEEVKRPKNLGLKFLEHKL